MKDYSNLNRILDDILTTLYKKKVVGNFIAIIVADLYKEMKPRLNIDLHDFCLLTLKLYNENFIDRMRNEHSDKDDQENTDTLDKKSICITINGIIHLQNGGYSEPIKKQKREVNIIWTLRIASWAVGLYALLNLVKYYLIPLFNC